MEEEKQIQEDIGMELIRQAAVLDGVAVCAQAVSRLMETGDISAKKGAAAVAFLGEHVMQVSADIMLLQEKI